MRARTRNILLFFLGLRSIPHWDLAINKIVLTTIKEVPGLSTPYLITQHDVVV